MKTMFLHLTMLLSLILSFQVSAKDGIHLSRICESSNGNEKIIVKYFSWYTVEDAWDDIIVEHAIGLKHNRYYFGGMRNCASDDGTLCLYQKCSMNGAMDTIHVNAIHKPSFGQSEAKFDNFLLDLTIEQNNKVVVDASGVTCRRATSSESDEEISRVGQDAFPNTCSIVNGKAYSTYR